MEHNRFEQGPSHNDGPVGGDINDIRNAAVADHDPDAIFSASARAFGQEPIQIPPQILQPLHHGGRAHSDGPRRLFSTKHTSVSGHPVPHPPTKESKWRISDARNTENRPGRAEALGEWPRERR
jgi:hypothetical protein